VIIFFYSCSQETKPLLSEDKKVSLANTYYNNDLFEAAIKEYEDYLSSYPINDNKRANINYTIANIYFERIKDYNKALEYFLRIKTLYPESKLQNDVGKRIVNCLERLQRSQDAQRVLEKETALKPDQVEEHKPGEIIAVIGDKHITQGDLDFEIEQLPPYLQSQFSAVEQKKEFLRQYIAEELLYDSAKRKGLEKEKEIVEGIQKMIDIKEADIELYYKANKEKYAEKDEDGKVIRQKSFQETAQQVAQDLFRERQQEAYQQLLDRLMKAENVNIYDKRIK
jgi:tetratricopeptide (TPR) repeat protein